MIDVERLKRVTHVFVHGNCPDGLASAMILRDAFRMLGTDPIFEFLVHNTEAHRFAGTLNAPGMSLFCDIAPHPAILDVEQGDTLRHMCIVLDHHKGAEAHVKAFTHHVFADEKEEPGVSGAVLAYREVWRSAWMAGASNEYGFPAEEWSQRVEVFATAIGVRDTWQKDHPEFERGQWASRMLMAEPTEFWMHPKRFPFLTEAEWAVGRSMFRAHTTAVDQAMGQVVKMAVAFEPDVALKRTLDPNSLSHVPLYVFQEQTTGFRLTSDVAESLRKEHQGEPPAGIVVGFSWYVEKPNTQPKILYSLRGLGGFDVAKFAKANGGGGHTAAAGFMVSYKLASMANPYQLIRDLVDRYMREWE